MTSLQTLLFELDNEQIIERLTTPQPDPEEINQLLDQRDTDAFSSRWMQSFRHVESKKAICPMPSASAEVVTKLRQSAYFRAFQRWNSPDLAGYISDDFGLIGDAIAMNIRDTWIERLLHSYLNGAVPCESQ